MTVKCNIYSFNDESTMSVKNMYENDKTEWNLMMDQDFSFNISYLLLFFSVIHAHPHPYPCQMKKSTAEIGSPFFLHTHSNFSQMHRQKINFQFFPHEVFLTLSTFAKEFYFNQSSERLECFRRAFITLCFLYYSYLFYL